MGNWFKSSMLMLMFGASMFFGGIMLYLGYEQMQEYKSIPEDHDIISAILWSYEEIGPEDEGTRYKLQYAYYVGNEEFYLYKESVRTVPPEQGETANVWVEWYNPENAGFYYKETYPMLFVAGGILFVVPIVFMLSALVVSGKINFFKGVSLIQLGMGLLFVAFGELFCYGIGGSFSPVETVKKGGITGVFPLIFLAAGAFLSVQSFLHRSGE